jgi:hypothetical protein
MPKKRKTVKTVVPKSDVPKSGSGTIHRIQSDGSVEVSIEACQGLNEWNLRFDVQRNVSLLKRISSAQLSEGMNSSEEEVETSLDSCLYVQACGIQLEANSDPSLLHVGSSFMFCALAIPPEDTEDDKESEPSSSDDFNFEVSAISAALKLQSDEGLKVLRKEYNKIEFEVHSL